MSQEDSDSWDLTDEEYEESQYEPVIPKKEPDNSGCLTFFIIIFIIILVMMFFRYVGGGGVPLKYK
jgi:hypothetical protein